MRSPRSSNELFAGIFRDCSHGFRKTFGTQSFFAQVKGWSEVDQLIEADIVSCFDNIKHDSLMDSINQYIKDDQFAQVIRAFLTTSILDKD